MNQCRILIVSDHSLFAEGVERLIAGQAGLEVIGVVSPDEALTCIPTLRLDVVIVDTDRATQTMLLRLLHLNPGTKFIGLSLDNNDINLYYQRNKKSTGVEALVEAIREPIEWKPPERKLRLLVMTQGVYGQRIADHISQQAPEHWIVQQWAWPSSLPDVVANPRDLLPVTLPEAELVLSLGQSPGVASLLPDVIQMTGAKGVIAPISNGDWLPARRMNQLREGLEQFGVAYAFPKPFCSLTEAHYLCGHQVNFEDGPIGEFARYFGQPALKISLDTDAHILCAVEVLRDSPCGCARYVAEKLMGVPVDQVEQQVEWLHRQFPCLASTTIDGDYNEALFCVSGRILRDAFGRQLDLLKVSQVPVISHEFPDS